MVEVSKKSKRSRHITAKPISTIGNLEELDEIPLNDYDDDHYHFHIYDLQKSEQDLELPTRISNDQQAFHDLDHDDDDDVQPKQHQQHQQEEEEESMQKKKKKKGKQRNKKQQITVEKQEALELDIDQEDHNHVNTDDGDSEINEDDDDGEYSDLDKWTIFLVWYSLAIISHFCKGGHAAFAQYLKSEESVAPPAFSLVAFGNLFVLLCYSPRIVQKCVNFYRQSKMELPSLSSSSSSSATTTTGIDQERQQELRDMDHHHHHHNDESDEDYYEQQRLSIATGSSGTTSTPSTSNTFSSSVISYWKHAAKHPATYLFILAIILRSFARGQALNYTTAIFIQLIELQSPFLITFLSIRLFRQRERADWPTIGTLIVTCLASVALILGQSTNSQPGFHWLPNFTNVVKQVSWSHLIGFALAFVGALALAMRTLTIDYIIASEHVKLSCENMFIVEKMCLTVAFLILSFLFGDFNQFGAMGWRQWSIFFLTSFLNEFVGSFLSIYCTAKLGGSTYGVMLPLRLLSTVIVSMVLLGEIVNNFWEILGFCIITISLASYMTWKKNRGNSMLRQRTGGKGSSLEEQRNSNGSSFLLPSHHGDVLKTPRLTESSRYRMEPFSNLKVENA